MFKMHHSILKTNIIQFQHQIIARSFNDNFKEDLTNKINLYVKTIENKENWEAISLNYQSTIDRFNDAYGNLITTIKYIGTSLIDQYRYNESHKIYSIDLLISYIKIVTDFLEDVIIPLDYFMQKVAAERRKNEPRLPEINKFIKLIKNQKKECLLFLNYEFWLSIDK